MIENQETKKADYREQVKNMGKKEFTLLKMQEYGFWPKDLPTPYERQANETKEDYEKRKVLSKEYEKLVSKIASLYDEKAQINAKLGELKNKYNATWDYERIRRDIATQLMKESIARRAAKKKQREEEKQKRSEEWKQHKAENIVFIGKGYSGLLKEKEGNEERLLSMGLPVIKDDKELAKILEIEYKELRFFAYHRDVVKVDHYYRYTIPKRSGGERQIAAPKSVLKKAQRNILAKILEKVVISENAHGFVKGKSIVSGAKIHPGQPKLLMNMDLEDFFPTITFERVRGMFQGFGYSGYIASLLAMLCTYCERMQIEIKGELRYIKTSERILPQGSPASPMITNIIGKNLDRRLNGVAVKYGFTYTRYADDMSFSFLEEPEQMGKIFGFITHIIEEEGFKVNQKKTKFIRKGNRQCVTGIVINNEQIGVPRKWVRQLRAAIYHARQMKEKGAISIELIRQISGMVSWLNGVNAERYKKIIEEATQLMKES